MGWAEGTTDPLADDHQVTSPRREQGIPLRHLRKLAPPTWSGRFAAMGWMVVPAATALLSRVVVLTVAYMGDALLPDNPIFPYVQQPHVFMQRWYGWDAYWYRAVALGGYQPAGREAATVAFWPGLPMLEWLGSRPLLALFPHVSAREIVSWTGLAIVSLAFIAGCLLLYRLVLEDYEPEVASRAVTFLAFAPGAVYYTAVYPTGLLLVGATGCLWALRRERWALAGLAGLGAALAQVPGCLLVLPFLWEYFTRRRGRLGPSALWALLIPLGPALWLLYLWRLTGDPLAPANAAVTLWPHHWTWPWQTVGAGAELVLRDPFAHTLDLLNLLAFFSSLVGALWALRSGHAGWGIWALAVLALYLCLPAYQPLDGMVRYTLPLLSTWLLMARVFRRSAAVVGASAAILSLLTALYVNRYWVA